MKIFWSLTKRELRSFFNSPLAYLFIAVFLVITSWIFFQNFFLIGQANMRGFFTLIPWVYLFLIPAITMRSWSEEKKLGTIELLLTLPVKDEVVVLGKFFASFLFLAITLLLSMMIPLVVLWAGPADVGVLFVSYLGALLLGGAYIALGVWVSALTDNQIIAFIASIVVTFFFFIIGELFVLQQVPDFLASFFQLISFGPHYQGLLRGVIDSRDVLYFLSFTFFFLFLNVRYISGRRFK